MLLGYSKDAANNFNEVAVMFRIAVDSNSEVRTEYRDIFTTSISSD
jgi:hypothetical protein